MPIRLIKRITEPEKVSVQNTLPKMQVGEILTWTPTSPDRLATDRKEWYRQAQVLGWHVKTKTIKGQRLKVMLVAKKPKPGW